MQLRVLRLLAAFLLALVAVPLGAGSASAASYVISGRVTGLNASGTVVGLPQVAVDAWAGSDRATGSMTDASGYFTLTLPAGGAYQVHAWCPTNSGAACFETYASEWFADAVSQDVSTSVQVSDGTASTANIRLDRWGTLKGRVTDEAGNPVSSVKIQALGNRGGERPPATEVTPDVNGYYTLTTVDPGTQYVWLTDSSDPWKWQTQWDTQVTVAAGPATTTHDFVVKPATGIVGKATDTNGAPLENIEWSVLTKQADGTWMGMQRGPNLTAADGTFQFQGTVGGQYKVCFNDTWYSADWAPTYRHEARCWDNALTDDTATVITLDTARVASVTQALPTAGLSMTPVDPWVTGTAAVGSTVKLAELGTWAPSDATFTYQWGYWVGSDFHAIPGATGTSYTITAAEQGKWLQLDVTGRRSGYATTVKSGSAGLVGGTTPTTSAALAITGTPTVGQTLSLKRGTYTPAGGYASQEWLVDGKPAGDERRWNDTFLLTSADAGKRISVRSQYSEWDTTQNALQEYAVTGPVGGAAAFTTAPVPTVSGSPVAGQTLTGSLGGTWSPTPDSYTYAWLRNGVAIAGATGTTYALTNADAGATITFRATATKAGYTTTSKDSAPTAAVKGVFTSAPVPTITGTTAVNYTLTANTGTWSPVPDSFAYQWYRVSGTGVTSAIAGATLKTYKLTSADLNYTIKVKVTGQKTNHVSRSVTSAATAKVLNSFTAAPTPTLTGTAVVGQTLTGALGGTWSPTPERYSYNWFRVSSTGTSTVISGATATTYKLTTADVGYTIRFRVGAVKTGYVTTYRSSSATTKVLNAFTTAPVPTISGTKTVGYTLTANPGTWSPTPDSFTYQWYRVSSTGTSTAISGATLKSYQLTAAERGYTIKVRVVARKTGCAATGRTSAATTAIG